MRLCMPTCKFPESFMILLIGCIAITDEREFSVHIMNTGLLLVLYARYIYHIHTRMCAPYYLTLNQNEQ